MIILKKMYKITAVFVFLFGLMALYLSLHDLTFGSLGKPKSGFVPTVFSGFLVGFAAVNLVLELRKPDKIPPKMEQVDWKKWGLYIAVSVAYIVMLRWAGFLVSTAVCLFAMIKTTGMKAWVKPAMVSIIFSGIVWIIFTYAMNVRLPSCAWL